MLHKNVSAIVRRPDLTREAFRAYYEAHHTPLAVRHFPFARYVRNHIAEPGACGFDVLSEFWFADPDKIAAVLQGPAGPAIRHDELQFMDKPRNRPASAQELVLAPPAPAPPERRMLHLLDWPDGQPAMAVIAAEWASGLASQATGISLDLVTPQGPNGFPAKALAWSDLGHLLPSPPAGITLTRLAVRRIETAPEHLLGACPTAAEAGASRQFQDRARSP